MYLLSVFPRFSSFPSTDGQCDTNFSLSSHTFRRVCFSLQLLSRVLSTLRRIVGRASTSVVASKRLHYQRARKVGQSTKSVAKNIDAKSMRGSQEWSKFVLHHHGRRAFGRITRRKVKKSHRKLANFIIHMMIHRIARMTSGGGQSKSFKCSRRCPSKITSSDLRVMRVDE